MRKRHVHDLSNYSLLQANAGELTPLKVTEMLPNDTFVGNSEAVIRMSALKRPVMHPLKVKLFHYFCPTRLVWPEWEKFITQGKYGSTPPVHPYITISSGDALPGSFLDRMGVKVPSSGNLDINAIPISMYNLIVNKYHMDQDIGTENARTDISGNRTGLEAITGFQVNWGKDYFTTARPWAQKSPSIPILNSEIPINRYGNAGTWSAKNAGTNTNAIPSALSTDGAGNPQTTAANISFDPNNTLYANGAAAGDVPDLRMRTALQRFFENRSADGSRLIEYLRSSFGANVRDNVLQNPELINYSEKTIQFSEVLQTAEGTDPVGTLRGHGVGGLRSNNFKFYAQEHGYFITLMYIMPECMYVNSMERYWLKNTFSEYFQQEFEAIGEQPIYQSEINPVSTSNANRKNPWGWTHRYDDYRRALHLISGQFRTTELDWHMARLSSETAVLNDSFLRFPPTNRIFADDAPTAPFYQIMAYHKLVARRNVKRNVKNRIL